MRFANLADRATIVVADGCVDVVFASDGHFGPDPMAVLGDWTAFTAWAATADLSEPTPFDPALLAAPVPRPRQVFAVTRNYPPHPAEAEPLVCTKFPTCVTGPHATVHLPGDHVDWAVELVAVIGRGGHHIRPDRAWDHVAGLTIGQDLTERRVQMLGTAPQYSLSKSFPGFGPTGPVLVTPDELPAGMAISCLLNGTVVQDASTADMVFDVPDLVARLSAICPLLPGDLVFTGTPAGTGHRMTPPRHLTPFDELTGRIEGIGELRTRFRR